MASLQVSLNGAQSPLVIVDDRRRSNYQPGKLITSVKMDQNALECFYCCATCPCCCCKHELAKATYMDVYSNGVEIGKPFFLCCCTNSSTSIGVRHHFDDLVVFQNTAVKGELCGPYPFCCVNKCDCFGEAIVMQGACCRGTRFFGLGNQYTTCSWCPIISCCLPISVMYGLAPGEAARVSNVINNSVANFRNNSWQLESQIAQAMGMGGALPQNIVVNMITPVVAYPQTAYHPDAYQPVPAPAMGEPMGDPVKTAYADV